VQRLELLNGITSHLEKRLWEHNVGQDKNSYTYTLRPVELNMWKFLLMLIRL